MLPFKQPLPILIFKALVIISVSLVLTLLIELCYLKYSNNTYDTSQNIFPKKTIEQKYEIVALGNSHTENGITFEKYNVKGLNLGSVAQRFNYDLAMLKHHKNEIAPNAIILINASPISFSHSKDFEQKSFQKIYYKKMSPLFIPNLVVGEYIEAVLVPFTNSGYHWRKWIQDQITEQKSLEEFNQFQELSKKNEPQEVAEEKPEIPKVTTNNHTKEPEIDPETLSPFYIPLIEEKLASPSAKPEDLAGSVNFMKNKWLNTKEFSQEYFEENIQDLEKIITYSLKNNWRPIVITIPISEELEKSLTDEYMQTYLYNNIDKTNLQGVEYLDFTQNTALTKRTFWFSNSDHFNREGSAAFSYVLLKTLIEKKYLPENTNNYIQEKK